MDLFKFANTGEPTELGLGEPIDGWKKATWVERYFDPGEFTIEAPLSSGLGGKLPLGTLISHVETPEVMIVENIEIPPANGEEETIVISGRGFHSFFENRAVGTKSARAGVDIDPYVIPAFHTWVQLEILMNDHIHYSDCALDDSLSGVIAGHTVSGSSGEVIERNLEPGYLSDHVKKIAQVDGLGIRTIRGNSFGLGWDSTGFGMTINIYSGQDLTNTVMFSQEAGDIEDAHYLFSLKPKKTSALVVGTYLMLMVDGPETKYDRRVMIVDGKDIDGHFTSIPTDWDAVGVLVAMDTRGKQALSSQYAATMVEVDLSPKAQYHYRRDYYLGDLVLVNGKYGQIEMMRVTECAEIEDESGRSVHPTLTVPGD